jgi:HlyD family secretion protein
MLRNKIIFSLVAVGIVSGVGSAYVYAVPNKPLPPVFAPAPDPYAQGIYAEGMVESSQANGMNINIYPEVPGVITQVLVTEGDSVKAGAPLVVLEDSVQRGIMEQQRCQVEAARAALSELTAQPRPETLEVARAQVEMATASLKNAEDQMNKQKESFALSPESVSKNVLDNAVNAFKVAKANSDVVSRQYQLTKAGAWVYDIRTQQKQVEAFEQAYASSLALLGKYTIKAPVDGVVLSVQAAVGSYVSSLGAYDPYTQGMDPILVMGNGQGHLNVRCYVDEILIGRLPPAAKIHAQMFIRGTNTQIPLRFVRVQPYVSPKIQLSNQRLEKVDVRVLPAIFQFEPTPGVAVYPGELVDVYIGDGRTVPDAGAH